MKKTLSVFLAVVMIFTTFFALSVNSFAANNTIAVYTDKKTYSIGETATVNVALTADNLSGIDFSLVYNKSTYSYVSHSVSTNSNLGQIVVGTPNNQIHFASTNVKASNFSNVYVLTVKFKVIGNVDTDIILKLVDALNGEDKNIVSTFNVVSKTLYPDTPYGEWYYPAVKFATQNGYFHGYQNGNFGPGNNIQRQDFVVVLANVASADLTQYQGQNGNFKDVPTNDYYSAAVAWAVDNGIISGYQGTGKFGVGDFITREQVCAILYRYMANYCGNDVELIETEDEILSSFSDAGNVSGWAKTNVAWAIENSVISGTKNGVAISPAGNANRAQIAQILMNMSINGLI